jgi:hypothetical protein
MVQHPHCPETGWRSRMIAFTSDAANFAAAAGSCLTGRGRRQRSNMALQRTRRPRFRSGRSLRSLGSPLNAQPLDAPVGVPSR